MSAMWAALHGCRTQRGQHLTQCFFDRERWSNPAERVLAMRTYGLALAAILLYGAAATLAQTAEPAVSSAAAAANVASAATAQNYVVAPNDVLDVYIIDVPELSRSYRVEPDGKLKFPFLKALPAAGMTLEQLSAALAKGLKEGPTRSRRGGPKAIAGAAGARPATRRSTRPSTAATTAGRARRATSRRPPDSPTR
ncbi:MAG TPA: polysaccharide biosynthesis/export family protein, partial [Terriglobales bacterium]|nr:polysaccharide biosynthesis/export family protein [Terriglobales bacterium]